MPDNLAVVTRSAATIAVAGVTSIAFWEHAQVVLSVISALVAIAVGIVRFRNHYNRKREQ